MNNMFYQTLTGQKYGEPLLPPTIIESEFDAIIKVNYSYLLIILPFLQLQTPKCSQSIHILYS